MNANDDDQVYDIARRLDPRTSHTECKEIARFLSIVYKRKLKQIYFNFEILWFPFLLIDKNINAHV